MSSMNGDKRPGTGWSVQSQSEMAKVSSSGQIEDGITVGFRTQYGQSGSVWIPKNAYTPEMVAGAIVELASQMDAVHTMTG